MSFLSNKKIYNVRKIYNYSSINYSSIDNYSLIDNYSSIDNNKYSVVSKSQIDKDFYNVDKQNSIMHPITLTMVKSYNEPLCLTKFNYKNNKIEFVNNYKCNYTNKYKDFLYIPPVFLSYGDILKIYDIYDIESLYNWVEQNLPKKTSIHLNTIARVVKCWLKHNYSDIKIYTNYISKIIYMIFIISNYNVFENVKEKDLVQHIISWYNENLNNIENDNSIFKYIINKYNKI